MELKHYTLSQLLETYSGDHTIIIRVEPGYNVEFIERRGLRVKTVATELEAVVPPSQFSVIPKRLYKMRFVKGPACMGQNLTFEASVGGTKVVVTVVVPKVDRVTASECEQNLQVEAEVERKQPALVKPSIKETLVSWFRKILS